MQAKNIIISGRIGKETKEQIENHPLSHSQLSNWAVSHPDNKKQPEKPETLHSTASINRRIKTQFPYANFVSAAELYASASVATDTFS